MTNTIFLDVEASGLHPTSYPVEVAWVAYDLSLGWSSLIRPAPDWGEADWNPEAEKIHGISRHELLMAGRSVTTVAARLNADLADRNVMTDSPGQDGAWLWRLFDAAGVPPSFAMMSKGAAAAQWTSAMVPWRGRKVLLDADVLVAQAAGRARIAPDEQELFAAALNAEAGIVPHRALDDAVAHALSLGAVGLLELARERGDAAARSARIELVERARRSLAEHRR